MKSGKKMHKFIEFEFVSTYEWDRINDPVVETGHVCVDIDNIVSFHDTFVEPLSGKCTNIQLTDGTVYQIMVPYSSFKNYFNVGRWSYFK